MPTMMPPLDLKQEDSSRDSESPGEVVQRAHRTCEKCTRTKKKCDKALPSCSRCTRLQTPCCYDFVYTAPATAAVEPAALASILDPTSFDIPPSVTMSVLSSRNVKWPEVIDVYLSTINTWLHVVHPILLAAELEALPKSTPTNGGSSEPPLPTDPDLALLILCMHLVTLYADSARSQATDGQEMFRNAEYVIAKRLFGLARGFGPPTLRLVQCCILLAVFEFGHGDFSRAYVSVGDAYTMVKFLGIRPGEYVEEDRNNPVDPEEEQRRSVYWSIFVLDRLLHIEADLLWKPLHLPPHSPNDLLPTCNVTWDPATQQQIVTSVRYPASIVPSIPLGPFQRNCQCAMLYARALAWELETHRPESQPPSVTSFSELDFATRSLIEAMISQSPRWGDHYACFATLTSLLLLLYRRYLQTLPPSTTISATSADVEVAKAVAGVNFTVRIVADTTTDFNEYLSHRPELLAPCSPVTPFSAYHCLRTLSTFESIIPDADDRFHDLYSSLHFYAKRWGVGAQLVRRIETSLMEEITTNTANASMN